MAKVRKTKRESLDFNGLGDKHKKLEQLSAGQKLIPGVPTIARLDGRAFHTFLKNAKKPFDPQVIDAMQETAKALLSEFGAKVAYVQSDEITLVWDKLEVFDGKVQKLLSTTASLASVKFYSCLPNRLADCVALPTFDCRIWQVSDLDTAAENLLWRELDATKNSVSMMASAYFSESDLVGKSTKDRLTMLENMGIKWADLSHWLKKGSYYKKVEKLMTLTEEELAKIPEKYRPTEPVLRSVIELQEYPKASSIINFADVLFHDKPIKERKHEPR